MQRHRVSLSSSAVVLGFFLCFLAAPLAADVEGEWDGGLNWFVEEDNPDSAKFEAYREVPNGFVSDRFRLSWEPHDRFYLDLSALDVAQDDQRIKLAFGSLDWWKIDIDWNENPRRFSDFSRQIHTHQGDGVFTSTDVPAGVDFGDFVVANAYDVSLGYQRKRGDFDVTFTPTKELTLGLETSRERRDGTMPTVGPGYAFGGVGGIEVAYPIDFVTDTVTGHIEWAGELFTVGGRYTWSEFDSENDRLFWTDLLREPPNPSSEHQLDFSDDSTMTQWSFYLAGNLPGRTRISATASQGNIENDDTFLPLTVNQDLLAGVPLADRLAGLPLDGEYDTALYNVRISGRPAEMFSWNAWWRRYELDRDGSEYEIRYIAADDHVSELRRTLNYGYEKENTGASLTFSPIQSLAFGVEYERESWDRENTPVHELDEDRYKAHLDVTLKDRVWLRASYERQEREGDHYDFHFAEEELFPEGEDPGAANLGSRAFIWSDRDRDQLALDFEVYPTEVFSIYGQARWYQSDYMDPNTGQDIGSRWLLTEERRADIAGPETYSLLLAGRSEDEGNAYTLGFSVAPNENFNLYADYTWESYEYTVWSRERGFSGSLNNGDGAFGDDIVGVDTSLEATWIDWTSDNEDEYRTAALGFQAHFPDTRWDVNGDFLYHEGEGSFGQRVVVNEFGETFNPFPPGVDSQLLSALVSATFNARSYLAFTFGYWYEKWEEDDWQWDFNEPYMGRSNQDPGGADGDTTQFLGTDFEDYENHILTFKVRYRF